MLYKNTNPILPPPLQHTQSNEEHCTWGLIVELMSHLCEPLVLILALHFFKRWKENGKMKLVRILDKNI